MNCFTCLQNIIGIGLWLIAFNKGYSQNLDFALGKALFDRLWIKSPSTLENAEGLGPIYNARSCLSCHEKGGGSGKPFAPNHKLHHSTIVQLVPNDPDYGRQLQTRSILGVKPEANIRYTVAKDLKVKLDKYDVQMELNYGGISEDTIISLKVAPRLYNLKAIESISDTQILDNLNNPLKLKDGVFGKVSYVTEKNSRKKIGKFGWTASVDTLKKQTAKAFFLDIGLSSKYFHKDHGDCTITQIKCQTLAKSSKRASSPYELKDKLLNLTTEYTSRIGAKDYANRYKKIDESGLKVFKSLGCHLCHTPSYKINQKEVYLFSDLLLHDLGDELKSFSKNKKHKESMYRTAPLTGIGYYLKKQGSLRYLHDGRADTIEKAILWHKGEATASRKRFLNMDQTSKTKLIQFIQNL